MEWKLKAAAVSAAAISAWEAIMGRQEFAAIENGCIGEAPEDMFFRLGMMYSTGVQLATDYVSAHKCSDVDSPDVLARVVRRHFVSKPFFPGHDFVAMLHLIIELSAREQIYRVSNYFAVDGRPVCREMFDRFFVFAHRFPVPRHL